MLVHNNKDIQGTQSKPASMSVLYLLKTDLDVKPPYIRRKTKVNQMSTDQKEPHLTMKVSLLAFHAIQHNSLGC